MRKKLYRKSLKKNRVQDMKPTKEYLEQVIEESGTKPYWKYIWYAYMIVSVLIIIEYIMK